MIHAWIVIPSLGQGAAMAMVAFFFIQAAALPLERSLRVAHWPEPLGRLWTMGLVLLPSPLFVGPLLASFGQPPLW